MTMGGIQMIVETTQMIPETIPLTNRNSPDVYSGVDSLWFTTSNNVAGLKALPEFLVCSMADWKTKLIRSAKLARTSARCFNQ